MPMVCKMRKSAFRPSVGELPLVPAGKRRSSSPDQILYVAWRESGLFCCKRHHVEFCAFLIRLIPVRTRLRRKTPKLKWREAPFEQLRGKADENRCCCYGCSGCCCSGTRNGRSGPRINEKYFKNTQKNRSALHPRAV